MILKYPKVIRTASSLLVALLLSTALLAQSRDDLEAQRAKKLEEIALTQRLIDETDEAQRKNINYLVILNRQIRNRGQLIVTEERVLKMLNTSIDNTELFVEVLATDLESLKSEYKEMAYHAFKTRSKFDYLIYIFASKSLQEAWNRMRYIKYYNEVRENQIDLIRDTQKSLQGKVVKLKKEIETKKKLISGLQVERQKLLRDKRSKNKILSDLRGKEDEYREKIKEDKKIAKELDNAIEEIISREMAKNETLSGLGSEEFAKNRANFIWPAVGIVSSSFGRQEHPSVKGVYLNNNGIDIRTEKNETARTVFAGTVVHVVFIPGANSAIIIRHGEYYTVYKNLIDVIVKPGDVVEEGSELGKVFFDETKGVSELHFEVRHQTEKLNPLLWLKKK